eukprot:1249195-Prymnesium_polylepis.2
MTTAMMLIRLDSFVSSIDTAADSDLDSDPNEVAAPLPRSASGGRPGGDGADGGSGGAGKTVTTAAVLTSGS